MSVNPHKEFRIRSFVGRNSRSTVAQTRALEESWPAFGLNVTDGVLDFADVFGRVAPTYLEIGFGSGQTLLAAAEKFPEKNFIGVETHLPGIGALLLGVNARGLTNLRVFQADVVDVLEKNMADNSLAGVQIFFPDPWQKRKHHQRRLVQPEFLQTLAKKIMPGGTLHLATDWEDYAIHMMKVVSVSAEFHNVAGAQSFAGRSPYRPEVSKFERRAMREGRQIWEIALKKL